MKGEQKKKRKSRRPGLRDKIIKEYKGGLGGTKVAKKLNCSESWVYLVLEKAGIAKKPGV